MIQKTVDGQVTNYFYNIENRLTQIQNPQSEIYNYYYDPFGRRLWKEVSGTRTYFLYADEGLIGEYDSTGSEIKTYGYKPGSTWTTDPLFMKDEGEYCFYQNDHLGTPQKMIGVNGGVVWSAKYSSFGETTVDPSSTIINKLRFPGQYFDFESGLYYNCHRYYDPGIGRYLREDPLCLSIIHLINQNSLNNLWRSSNQTSTLLEIQHFLFSYFLYQYGLTNTQALNLYSYIQNNVVNYRDPHGQFGFAGAAIGGAIGGVMGGVGAALGGAGIGGIAAGTVAGALGGIFGGAFSFSTAISAGFGAGFAAAGAAASGGNAGAIAGAAIGGAFGGAVGGLPGVGLGGKAFGTFLGGLAATTFGLAGEALDECKP